MIEIDGTRNTYIKSIKYEFLLKNVFVNTHESVLINHHSFNRKRMEIM